LLQDLIWTYLLVINAGSLLLIGFDKLRAKLDSERVPEIWFFLISAAGGVMGVVLGMFAFHHKTSKRGFQVKIAIAALIASILFFSVLRG